MVFLNAMMFLLKTSSLFFTIPLLKTKCFQRNIEFKRIDGFTNLPEFTCEFLC